MMTAPLFSVVVITFNQEEYISHTLDSIIGQDHKYSYEIIIGEDCSSDGTRDILLRYQKRYPDIIRVILNDRNLGLIKNYFSTIKHCSGKYIMQCAGDDYWLPGKVRTQIKFMEDNPDVGMCCGNVQNLYLDGKMTKSNHKKRFCSIIELMKKNEIAAVSICLRKIIFLEYIVAVNPIEKNWLIEDYPMHLWFVCNSKIYYLNELLAVYRLSKDSIMRQKKYDHMKQLLNSIMEMKRFFLNAYEIRFSEENLRNSFYLGLAGYAVKYSQYKEYNAYIKKIPSYNIKIIIKKIIGKSPFLFKIYSLRREC